VVATAGPAIQVRQLSILDETSHIDSVFKVPAIDRSGEKYSERTLDEVSCRGRDSAMAGLAATTCGIPQGVPADDYVIGSGGYNTADIHPPTYYFLTALLSTAASWFVDADPVALMRLTGASTWHSASRSVGCSRAGSGPTGGRRSARALSW